MGQEQILEPPTKDAIRDIHDGWPVMDVPQCPTNSTIMYDPTAATVLCHTFKLEPPERHGDPFTLAVSLVALVVGFLIGKFTR
jgi:hypothetical protein